MIVALLAPLVYAAVPDAPLLPTREETLANGLRVVAHQMVGTDRVAVRLALPRGAAEDPPGRAGLAHLVEHLSYEGPRLWSGFVADYDGRLAEAGGSSQGTTTHDAIVFSNTVPADALPLAVFLEASRFAVPEPTAEALDNQRAVVARERAERARSEAVRAALAMVSWPAGHPYGHTVLGDPDALDAVTIEEAHAAMRAHLRPEGGVLVVVGPHEPEVLLRAARGYFGEVVEGEAEAGGDDTSDTRSADTRDPFDTRPADTRDTSDKRPADTSNTRGPVRVWLPADVYPVRLRVAWRTVPSRHPDAATLDLLGDLLGDALADEGIDVLHWAGARAGSLIVATDTERPARALARIRRAVNRLAARGPTDDALARVRARSRTLDLARLDSPAGRAAALAGCALRTGAADCLPSVWAERAAVDAADVRDAARRWLDQDAGVVLAAAPWKAPLPGMSPVEAP